MLWAAIRTRVDCQCTSTADMTSSSAHGEHITEPVMNLWLHQCKAGPAAKQDNVGARHGDRAQVCSQATVQGPHQTKQAIMKMQQSHSNIMSFGNLYTQCVREGTELLIIWLGRGRLRVAISRYPIYGRHAFSQARASLRQHCCGMYSAASGVVDAAFARCQVFSLDTEQEPNRRMYHQLRVQERAQTNFVLSRRGARERHGHHIRRWRAWRRTVPSVQHLCRPASPRRSRKPCTPVQPCPTPALQV